MRLAISLLVVAPLAAAALPGQIPPQYETGGLTFDVASIRPADPDSNVNLLNQLMGIRRQRELFAPSVTVRDLIRYAYEYQFRPVSLIQGGPDWLDTERYQVVGQAAEPFERAPGRGLLPRSAATMLRSLLVERMLLQVRIELQERTVYALVLDRPEAGPGPNLTPADGKCQPSMATFDPAIPLPPCPFTLRRLENGSLYEMKGMTLEEIASTWGNFPDVNDLVVDRTGLAGRWDMSVRFQEAMTLSPVARPVPLSVDEIERGEYPPIRIAMQEQLGLRLERTRAPVEAIVIESVERPSPN